MKIVVYDRLEEDLQQLMQKAADGCPVVFPESEEALKETGGDAEIFYGCHYLFNIYLLILNQINKYLIYIY